jgi:hypothetical protein
MLVGTLSRLPTRTRRTISCGWLRAARAPRHAAQQLFFFLGGGAVFCCPVRGCWLVKRRNCELGTGNQEIICFFFGERTMANSKAGSKEQRNSPNALTETAGGP